MRGRPEIHDRSGEIKHCHIGAAPRAIASLSSWNPRSSNSTYLAILILRFGFAEFSSVRHNEDVLSTTELHSLADQLVEIPGVVGVLLGGNRARGEEHPDSDFDL